MSSAERPVSSPPPRQGILSLRIKDLHALYHAYMPFTKHGGLFIPTQRSYRIGDEVFMLLTLMDAAEKIPVAGRVVWITPQGAQGNRTAGIGVQFNAPNGESARAKIETLLAGMLKSTQPTHTL